ncbi:venom carboxylesterase-6-like, partial [Agrilus planipennis]|uniref:Carboxylic ester hydrolase n=1 Tax=Agrilus planipennis TaxID=224129 RepID=A0A7F5R4R0_AGRPL
IETDFCKGRGEFPEVNTDLGKIRGSYRVSVLGRKYAAFEGIPYAEPPIQEYRFEEPQEKRPWQGIWIANNTYTCLQLHHAKIDDNYKIEGQEDCLYINIYSPQIKRKDLDVIVFIHGGAFMFGNGHFYEPDILMDKDVVYVSLNYRVGILGFLSTEDSVIPGNFGLKDQLMALKWIQKYISAFGGNTDSVTITGMSAGGASVHIHYLSPLSEGLFHKGYSQSGTALNPWVLVENSLEKAKLAAHYLGCPSGSSVEILECLRQRPGLQIVETTRKFFSWLYNPFSPFGVVVDKWSKNPILPDHPIKILESGKVKNLPWIFSMTESEGLYPAAEFVSNSRFLQEIQEQWDTLLPHILDFNHTLCSEKLNPVAQEIRDYYFKDKPISENSFSTLVKLIGDRLFVVDIETAAKLQASRSSSPVYFYYFTYIGTHSLSDFLSGNTENYGASHGDDTLYVLRTHMQKNCTEEDIKMASLMRDLWSSFAHIGIPHINDVIWQPISRNKAHPLKYLHIGSPSRLQMAANDNLGNKEFWDSLPYKENYKLFNQKDEL